MSELTVTAPAIDAELLAAAARASCDECAGSGGWFRYEPAVEGPGVLYLSCLECRGGGWLASAKA